MNSFRAEKPPVIVITGPTGIGKTNISYHLAELLGRAEIVSCDSMAVYRGMDVGTSKPQNDICGKIPHHMIDVVGFDENFDVAAYVDKAKRVIKQITERRNIPLITGGSVMYLYSLLDGIFKGPGRSDEMRKKLFDKTNLVSSGNKVGESLYQELMMVDPEAAGKIHPHDLRRIVRGLEVYYLTGCKISSLRDKKNGIFKDYNVFIYAINDKRPEIYRRIDERVDKMIKDGLLDEVKKIASSISLTAYQGQGYKEIIEHLNGKYDFNEAIRLIKRNTRRFAKRQLSWLKRDKRVIWIERSEFESDYGIAAFIAESFKKAL